MSRLKNETFLALIRDFRTEHHYAPTAAEIALQAGLSLSATTARLRALAGQPLTGGILIGKKLGGMFGPATVWFYLTNTEAGFFGIETVNDTNTEKGKEQ